MKNECTVVFFSIDVQNVSTKCNVSNKTSKKGAGGGGDILGIEDISNNSKKKIKIITKTPFVILLANQSAVVCACCIFFYATCQSINGKCIELLCVFCLVCQLVNRAELHHIIYTPQYD